jgi:ferredoxin-NADP reductase
MKLIFLSKKSEGGDAYSFVFKSVEPTEWLSGQSIRLEIDGHERRFSIVSAPFEQNIVIATRLGGSEFKNALNALKPGDQIDGYNIEGAFVWDEKASQRFLIAGGIGITAYYPMFKQLDHDQRAIEARLVYTSHDRNFLFKQELTQLQASHPEFKLELHAGSRFSKTIAEKHKQELLKSMVYISGPEAMVNAVHQTLLGVGVDENAIKRDLFTGFDQEY